MERRYEGPLPKTCWNRGVSPRYLGHLVIIIKNYNVSRAQKPFLRRLGVLQKYLKDDKWVSSPGLGFRSIQACLVLQSRQWLDFVFSWILFSLHGEKWKFSLLQSGSRSKASEVFLIPEICRLFLPSPLKCNHQLSTPAQSLDKVIQLSQLEGTRTREKQNKRILCEFNLWFLSDPAVLTFC